MGDEEERVIMDDEALATKELMRQMRKREYEKAKAQRKKESLEAKQQAAEKRQAERAERQKALWDLVQKGDS